MIKENFHIENDKYYTPEWLVQHIINVTSEIVGSGNITEWLEPSAGAGAFLNSLDGTGKPWKAFDLIPEDDRVVRDESFVPVDYSMKNVKIQTYARKIDKDIDMYVVDDSKFSNYDFIIRAYGMMHEGARIGSIEESIDDCSMQHVVTLNCNQELKDRIFKHFCDGEWYMKYVYKYELMFRCVNRLKTQSILMELRTEFPELLTEEELKHNQEVLTPTYKIVDSAEDIIDYGMTMDIVNSLKF